MISVKNLLQRLVQQKSENLKEVEKRSKKFNVKRGCVEIYVYASRKSPIHFF